MKRALLLSLLLSPALQAAYKNQIRDYFCAEAQVQGTPVDGVCLATPHASPRRDLRYLIIQRAGLEDLWIPLTFEREAGEAKRVYRGMFAIISYASLDYRLHHEVEITVDETDPQRPKLQAVATDGTVTMSTTEPVIELLPREKISVD